MQIANRLSFRERRQTRATSITLRRKGAVLLVALACLALVAVVAMVVVKTQMQLKKQAELQEFQTQAEWLAESGIERGVAQLRASHKYRGEVWKISADELQERGAGEVTIEVVPSAADAATMLIRATGLFPSGQPIAARYTKEVIYEPTP